MNESSQKRRMRRRAGMWLALLIMGLGVGLFGAPVEIARAQDPVQEADNPRIVIDMSQTRGTISAQPFGLILGNKGHDAPELMHYYRTPGGRQELSAMGVKMLYYWADRDNWQAPYNAYTAQPETFPSVMDTTEFLILSQSIGAEPMIAVNITHRCQPANPLAPPSPQNVTCEMVTAQMAKDWLQYIKNSGRSVKWVQLGAEPYAGCYYWQESSGVNCTTDAGQHKIALPQEEYVKRVNQWATALRQVDPTIKLGLHLQPNTFTCKSDCGGVAWDEQLLKAVGNKVDFVITHQYYQIDSPATNEGRAQELSFYQLQRDVRLSRNGQSATPKQIRKELSKWLPSKVNIPIVIGEFNASKVDDYSELAAETRMSLYGSLAIAEAYLDMLSPVKLKGKLYDGAANVILLDLHNLPVMLSRFLPLASPSTLVRSPAWAMFGMLKDFSGKTWLSPKVEGNPKTSFGRPTLKVYAVKQGKSLWLAVFNRSRTETMTVDVALTGLKPKNGTMTRIGDNAPSFLSINSEGNPNAIAPSTVTLPSSQFKASSVTGVAFAPHSFTVLKISGK